MIYQVYFNDNQKGILEAELMPYKNEKCSVYFENSVIVEKMTNSDAFDKAEYFGVLSYNLRKKIEAMKSMRSPFKNTSEDSYSVRLMIDEAKKGKDVITFMKHEPHDMVLEANRIHPKFAEYWDKIIYQCGFMKQYLEAVYWDEPIYCNFFIAKHEVYKQYVEQLLIPAMAVMDDMPWLMENAHYPKQMSEDLQKQLGISHYPYHPFICERLFSFWYNFIYKK